MKHDLRGKTPESWHCIDCGINTAPGHPTRREAEQIFNTSCLHLNQDPSVEIRYNERCEVYHLHSAVWAKAGVAPFGGCLCIGCLEQRLGRRLNPQDFHRKHPFNKLPGSARSLERRGG